MFAQGLAAIALTLLIVSGIDKILDPDPTSSALRSSHMPSGRGLTRSLGIVETGVGSVGLAFGGVWLWPAAALYVGFTGFVIRALQADVPLRSCGCFGRIDTPPSPTHVVFNLTAVGAIVLAAFQSSPLLPWGGPVVELALYAVFALTGAYLGYLVLARLPILMGAARG